MLVRERVECVLAAKRQDEILPRHAEIARDAVQSGERDLLERRGQPARVAPLTCLARIGDRGGLVGRTAEREIRDDDQGDEAEGDEKRERASHARLRSQSAASGKRAHSVSALARKNGREKAFVTARSS